MRKLETFTGLRVLTYCIMSNHWHILLEVPSPVDVDDAELFDRINGFYSKQRARDLMQEFERAAEHARRTGCDVWLNELREQYFSRMGDLSVFVKELKERFSKWYNRRHNRRGTLWEERFKSVLVEDSENAISTMAAYIELNPVRAELVDDPRNYRFCGYAEAVAGGAAPRQGITQVLMLDPEASWRKIAAHYRMHLFSSGEQSTEHTGICPEEVAKVLKKGGELSRRSLLRCRVRYFSDGMALGSRLFVEEVFENNRTLFGERRKNGARKMHGGDWLGLCSLRNLTFAVTAPG